jgi:hypothetical protein
MLSPMMACEEAWLLGKAIRAIDPKALLVIGPVPTSGQDEVFKNSMTGRQTFVIRAEKVPNAAGIRRVIGMLGGPAATYDQLVSATPTSEVAALKGGWIVGGYLSNWLGTEVPPVFKIDHGFHVLQDILPTGLTGTVQVLLPMAAWAETEGCWENFAGRIQAFTAAIPPPEGARRAGDAYMRLLGRTGLYNADAVRAEMGEPFASVKAPTEEAQEPAMQFVEI